MSTPSSESVLPVSAVTEHRPTSRILRNVTANWVSLVINILLSFLIAPVVVNQLGDTYYGIWTLLMQLTGYLWLFDFGVRESVVKYVAQYHAAGQKQELSTIVRTAVSLYSVVAVVAMTAVALLAFLLPYAFNIPPEAVTTARATAFLTGATIAQGFVFNVFVGVVMGLQQFYRLAWANIAFAVGRALLTYLLVTNGLGIVSLALLQFGVSLAFTPTVVGRDLINLIVAPEVSRIDPSVSVRTALVQVPGLSTRRAKTTIELRDGQSFAIAGLLQQDYQNAISGLPWLGNLPILGALFRSTGFQRNETELVILVTPRLVKPAQSMAELSAPTDRLVLPSDTELFLFGQTEGEGSGLVPQTTSAHALPTGADALSKGQIGFSGNHGYIVE